MIFWDTSALVRAYAKREPGHDRASILLGARQRHAASVLLLPEAMGALSRMARGNRALRERILKQVRSDLSAFEIVPADLAQGELAARFAVEHELRGGDALHVAAASLLSRELGRGLRFVTADVDQAAAARREKLTAFLIA